MNLVWFLTIGIFLSICLGEFSRFPFGGGGGVSITLYDIFLSLSVVFLLIWQIGINKNLKSLNVLKVVFPFIAIALISLLFSGNITGGVYLIRFALYALSLWLGYSIVISKVIKIHSINKLIIGVGIFLSVVGLLQEIFIPDLVFLTPFGFDPHQARLVSTFLDPNFLGIFLNIILAALFFEYLKKSDKKWIIISCLVTLAIFLTFSRSSYLFLGIQLGSWGIFKFRKLLIVFMAIILLLFLFVPRFSERINGAFRIDKSSVERFASWESGFKLFYQNPILGVGFNNVRSEMLENNFTKTYTENGGHAGAGIDSSFLFVLATTGVLGFLSFAYLWIQILLWNKKRLLVILPMLIGLFISSQFVNALFYPPITFLLLFWLGSLRAHDLL